ncbi:MAG TPA: hypothetical protein VKT17_02655 [Acidobacteriota bacterium]|nr:hypothetical protein [Acidobacteriota bacterium]
MPNDRNRRRLIVTAAAGLLLVFAGTWIVLDITENRPGWLAVEGPATAAVGGRIEFRVRLEGRDGPGMIACTLHHADAEKRGWGYLASSGPPQPAVAGRTHTFVFTVPERADMAYVFALIYLSPTGRWEDGTRAVSTAYIPVVREGGAAATTVLRKTRLHRYPTVAESERTEARAARARGRSSVWIHPILGALLVAAAFLAVKAGGRSKAAARPVEPGERTAWLLLAAALTIGAVLEVSGIASHVAAWGRRLAEQQGLYELRRPLQKTVMALTAAGCFGLFILFIRAARRPGSHRYLWWAGIGLAAYLAVSFVGVLSFHAVDAARSLVWHGVSPFDALRGAGAAVALGAAGLAARRKTGRPPI